VRNEDPAPAPSIVVRDAILVGLTVTDYSTEPGTSCSWTGPDTNSNGVVDDDERRNLRCTIASLGGKSQQVVTVTTKVLRLARARSRAQVATILEPETILDQPYEGPTPKTRSADSEDQT
jgi:hypothetical protein